MLDATGALPHHGGRFIHHTRTAEARVTHELPHVTCARLGEIVGLYCRGHVPDALFRRACRETLRRRGSNGAGRELVEETVARGVVSRSWVWVDGEPRRVTMLETHVNVLAALARELSCSTRRR